MGPCDAAAGHTLPANRERSYSRSSPGKWSNVFIHPNRKRAVDSMERQMGEDSYPGVLFAGSSCPAAITSTFSHFEILDPWIWFCFLFCPLLTFVLRSSNLEAEIALRCKVQVRQCFWMRMERSVFSCGHSVIACFSLWAEELGKPWLSREKGRDIYIYISIYLYIYI